MIVDASGCSLRMFLDRQKIMICEKFVCVCVCVCVWSLASSYKTCSTSFPSGNQVGGLPLVVNTGEGVIGPSVDS